MSRFMEGGRQVNQGRKTSHSHTLFDLLAIGSSYSCLILLYNSKIAALSTNWSVCAATHFNGGWVQTVQRCILSFKRRTVAVPIRSVKSRHRVCSASVDFCNTHTHHNSNSAHFYICVKAHTIETSRLAPQFVMYYLPYENGKFRKNWPLFRQL